MACLRLLWVGCGTGEENAHRAAECGCCRGPQAAPEPGAGSEWCWGSPLAPALPFCPLTLKNECCYIHLAHQSGQGQCELLCWCLTPFSAPSSVFSSATAQVGLFTPGLCFCSVVSSWTQALHSEGCQSLTTGQMITAKAKSLLSTKRKRGGTEAQVHVYPCNKINNWTWACSVPSLETHAQWAKLSNSRQNSNCCPEGNHSCLFQGWV